MNASWQLHNKDNIKYFRLHFDEPSFNKLIAIITTRSTNQDLPLIQNNFGIAKLHILHQIHSDKLYYISNNNFIKDKVEGDGLFTDQKNVFLGIMVADCLPIYFFGSDMKVIGIVHSGWRGTLNEIGNKMVQAMTKQFKIEPKQLRFAFGPSINSCCYEIKQDLASTFSHFLTEKKISNAIIIKENKIFLDLKMINQNLLKNSGLIKVADLDLCTFCSKDLFYSARRQELIGRNYAIIGFQNTD